MPANRLAIDASINDKVSGPLDKLRDKFDRLGKSKGAQQILSGVGMGVGLKAFGLLEGAVGDVGGAIEGMVHKAMEYEVVSARLDAALKSNVKGWNGNREAVNQYIDGQVRIGFTVAETTASFAQLVAATGDVTKAQQFQAAAMDLARLKGISLAEASDALTKIEGGRYRILASLGIVIAKGATQAEALAAVQKIAAGQADAFAKTSAGSMAIFNARIDQASEKIGKGLLPIIATAGEVVGGFIDSLDGATAALLQSVDQTIVSLKDSGASYGELWAERQRLIDQEPTLIWESEQQAMKKQIATLDDLLLHTRSTGKATDDLITSVGRVGAALDNARGPTQSEADAMMNLVDSFLAVPDPKKLTAWLDKVGLHALDLSGAALDAYNNIRKLTGIDKGTGIGFEMGNPKYPGGKKFASGGWAGLHGPERVTVGEKGPEYIVPNNQLGQGVGGGGGAPVEIVIHLDGEVVARKVDERLYYKLSRSSPSATRK